MTDETEVTERHEVNVKVFFLYRFVVVKSSAYFQYKVVLLLCCTTGRHLSVRVTL